MKNKLLYILILLIVYGAGAQEKVKGNRNVTVRQTEINPFHTIDLDEDFEVEIIFNQIPSVEIETDENLHDYIEFEVIDSVLTFNKKARIRSKKTIKIKVAYNLSLKQIKTKEDAEIVSLNSMNLENATAIAKGSSKLGLTLKTTDFKFESDDRAKVKLNVTCENSAIQLSGNSKLEALINTVNLTGTLYQRADAEIEGSCTKAKLELDNYSQFNGKNFTVNSCDLICNIGSEAQLEVMENISVEASGSSAIYLYENPEIIINKMTDTSKLQKKVK
ncbi:GIN domain-containing protein [Flavisericum labens]|uniref:GIN domain-containing protein n=1 Tax=Flavisericum labens TaxID=3377112 RepID=UPI00387B38DF